MYCQFHSAGTLIGPAGIHSLYPCKNKSTGINQVKNAAERRGSITGTENEPKIETNLSQKELSTPGRIAAET